MCAIESGIEHLIDSQSSGFDLRKRFFVAFYSNICLGCCSCCQNNSKLAHCRGNNDSASQTDRWPYDNADWSSVGRKSTVEPLSIVCEYRLQSHRRITLMSDGKQRSNRANVFLKRSGLSILSKDCLCSQNISNPEYYHHKNLAHKWQALVRQESTTYVQAESALRLPTGPCILSQVVKCPVKW